MLRRGFRGRRVEPSLAGMMTIGLRPNLNTTFRELVDLKKELAKFMPAWHYALGGRGAF
jgi:hypothetical protein